MDDTNLVGKCRERNNFHNQFELCFCKENYYFPEAIHLVKIRVKTFSHKKIND